MSDFLASDLSPPREHPVVIHSCEPYPPTYILYNPEQLTRKSELERVITQTQQKGFVELWDYSAANVAILAARGVAARHVPLQILEEYKLRLRDYRAEGQTYDFGFCGGISLRRIAMINAFIQRGARIYVTKQFGEARDRELAKCRVILNFHYADDYKIYESVRCDPWLAIGVPVISEHSIDDDPRCINTSFDNFVNTAMEFLALHI